MGWKFGHTFLQLVVLPEEAGRQDMAHTFGMLYIPLGSWIGYSCALAVFDVISSEKRELRLRLGLGRKLSGRYNKVQIEHFGSGQVELGRDHISQ